MTTPMTELGLRSYKPAMETCELRQERLMQLPPAMQAMEGRNLGLMSWRVRMLCYDGKAMGPGLQTSPRKDPDQQVEAGLQIALPRRVLGLLWGALSPLTFHLSSLRAPSPAPGTLPPHHHFLSVLLPCHSHYRSHGGPDAHAFHGLLWKPTKVAIVQPYSCPGTHGSLWRSPAQALVPLLQEEFVSSDCCPCSVSVCGPSQWP